MMVEQHPIGRYQVLESMASGGQGSVYRAFDSRTGQIVALKVLHPSLIADSAYLERFRREASIAASIVHPNVVKVFEVGEDGDHHFIAMEYLPESLGRIIEATGPLPIQRAVEFGAQIARGLAAAHTLGIVHRDVKPQNVLIGALGEAKVTDFGIARAEALSTMTLPGSALGTPYYMSPEQADGNSVDTRSDVYSFGCLLYQMLTGTLPFRGTTPYEVLRKHREEIPPPIREMRSEVPAALVAVVDRCLAKRPEERFLNATQLVAALGAGETIPGETEAVPPLLSIGTDPSPEGTAAFPPISPPDATTPLDMTDGAIERELLSRALQHPATLVPLAMAAVCAIILWIYPPGFLPAAPVIGVLLGCASLGGLSFCWIYFRCRDGERAKVIQELATELNRKL